MAVDITNVITGELNSDENVLWVGQPEPSVFFSSADAFLVPVSILAGTRAIHFGAKYVLKLLAYGVTLESVFVSVAIGLPFVAAGLYLILGRFVYKLWRKRRTFYAVTDNRAISVVLFGKRVVLEQPFDSIPVLRKQVGRRGVGTITFGRSRFTAVWCGNTGMNCLTGFDDSDLIAFHDIKGADEVYNLIRAQIASEPSAI